MLSTGYVYHSPFTKALTSVQFLLLFFGKGTKIIHPEITKIFRRV
jgi:hypothetical protein